MTQYGIIVAMKVIITMDGRHSRFDEDGVEHIGLIDFLLDPHSF